MGVEATVELRRVLREGPYPEAPRGAKALTKGREGGKLPSGNLAVRSPARKRFTASRKAARNRW
jgi:hypothetical protein